jgi:glycerate 2-kinase
VSGADIVFERIDFRGMVRGADLVVTGEGTVDRSSLEGKAVGEVLRVSQEENVRCVLFAGLIDAAPPGVETHALSGDPRRAADDLVELGERLARAVGLGVA